MSFNPIIEYIEQYLGLYGIISLIQSPDFTLSQLASLNGITNLINPVVPVFIVGEIIYLILYYKFDPKKISELFDIPLATNLINITLSSFIVFDVLTITDALVRKHQLFNISFTWQNLFLFYLIWEFSHYVFHYTCHKVRLLWCLHSPHHAPMHMNLSVIKVGFFLHGVYANFVRTAICVFLGVPIQALFFVMVVDACWGTLIHVSEEVIPNGKLGFLNRLILTPAHHRVHHSSNPEYVDKNFCNTLPIWDFLFGTLKHQDDAITPSYGISRISQNAGFINVYFGEITSLIEDIISSDSWLEKCLLPLMPPGWSYRNTKMPIARRRDNAK